MGKNEIRLRRQRMTARGIDRFRNYNKVLERHEQTQRLKKVIRAFGFFLVILIVILLIIILSRWEEQYQKPISSSAFHTGEILGNGQAQGKKKRHQIRLKKYRDKISQTVVYTNNSADISLSPKGL